MKVHKKLFPRKSDFFSDPQNISFGNTDKEPRKPTRYRRATQAVTHNSPIYMNNLKVIGKVVDVLPEVSGTNDKGQWTRQNIIVEYSNHGVTNKIVLATFNDLVGRIHPGEIVECFLRTAAICRHPNENYTTALTAFKINRQHNGIFANVLLSPIVNSNNF